MTSVDAATSQMVRRLEPLFGCFGIWGGILASCFG